MKFFQKSFLHAIAGILFLSGIGLAHADQVTAGSTVLLSVSADGTSPFTYQWIKDGINMPGSTGPTLTLTKIQSSNAGNYAVLVTNAAGSTTSGVSTISVLPASAVPVITTQPSSQSVVTGSNVTFAVVASGTPTPTFQWKKNGTTISGAATASLTLSNVQSSSAGTYTVVVTNNVGSATSAGAVLTVTASGSAPVDTAPINSTPSNPSIPTAQANAISYNTTTFPATVAAGATVNFSYDVVNAGTKTWGANHYLSLRDEKDNYHDFQSLSGVKPGAGMTVNLSFIAPTIAGTYTYYVQALENGVQMFSTQATLTLTVTGSSPNAISYNATTFPATVATGATVNFSYNVTNTGTKAWGVNHYLSLRDAKNNYLDFQLLSGIAPGASATVNLSFNAPTVAGTYTYYVQALENGVQMFSTQATLTLTVAGSSPNAISYNTKAFPSAVAAGTGARLSYSVTNTGTKAWGANHYLSLRDENNNYQDFESLDGVQPGGSITVNLNFTAPTSGGAHTYYVQAVENGVQMFSTQATLILKVGASAPNAISYNTTAFPSAVAAGAVVNFSYNVTNAGTKAWGTNHYLALRDANNNYQDFEPLSGVTSGGNLTVNLRFTAPRIKGTYTYYVQALENGVELFNTYQIVELTVF